MSKVVKTVKKGFKKLRESKILKTIVVAAAIYYAMGAANAYFAAPEAGTAMTLGETGFTGATEALGGDIVAGGVGDTLAADVAATVGAPAAEVAGTAGLEAAGTDLTLAGGGGTAATQTALTSGAVTPSVGKGVVGGAMDWMKTNPMATMMLGQGIAGASQAKSEEEMQAKAAEERRSRGLMGVDYAGTYKGAPRPGIVASQVSAARPVAVPGQGIQEQTVRPIQKKNFPQLSKQGLIAKNTGY